MTKKSASKYDIAVSHGRMTRKANDQALQRFNERIQNAIEDLFDRNANKQAKFLAFEWLNGIEYDYCRCVTNGDAILHFHFDDYLDFEEFLPAWDAFVAVTQ